MNGFRRFRFWARALLARKRVERELEDEIRLHLELEAEKNAREGLAPEEARRRALLAFGGVERFKEEAREARGTRLLEDLIRDVGYGARTLRRSPGFTLVATLTLALGIGATTAVFSVVNGALLEPLPYPESDRLVAVWSRFLPESGFDFPQFPLSAPEYLDYRAQSRVLEDVAAYYGFGATILRDDGEPLRVEASAASANLFDILGVPPQLGRTPSAAEDIADGPSVVVLSDGIWRSAYGGDPAILGRTIRVNGISTQVIGVMPAGFGFPDPETELWTPLGIDPLEPGSRSAHYLSAIGRLGAGASLEQLRTELDALMARWKADYPDVHTGHFLFVRPMLDDVVGDARAALFALLGAVGLVLLVVCANVANLLLAKGAARQREVAVRRALGAGRGRLVRQFIAEGALLSAVGGGAGLLLAYPGLNILVRLGGASIPRAGNVAVDERVLLFSACVALLTTAVFAVVPALRAASSRWGRDLRSGGRLSTEGGRGPRLRSALVAAQVALAFVVAIGAGLTVRSFDALLKVDPGFRADHVLVADLSLPRGDYPEGGQVLAFYDRLRARLGGLPGVLSTAAVSEFPLIDPPGTFDFDIEGRPPAAPGEPAASGDFVIATPGLLETLGTGLVAGRYFEPSDREGALPVAVVNRMLARMFWPGESAVGKRIRMAASDETPWLTIIGVIDDIRYSSLDAADRQAWYIPAAQMEMTLGGPARSFTVAIRTAGDPMAIAPAVRTVVRDLDPYLPLIRLQSLESVVAESVARPRFTLTLFGAFAALALALGAIGLYGVLSFAVAQRARELSVRLALGANRSQAGGPVLRHGIGLALTGLAIGFVLSLAASRLVRGLLFQVSPADPATYAAVALTLIGVSLAACVVPVRRAMRMNPAVVLREE